MNPEQVGPLDVHLLRTPLDFVPLAIYSLVRKTPTKISEASHPKAVSLILFGPIRLLATSYPHLSYLYEYATSPLLDNLSR